MSEQRKPWGIEILHPDGWHGCAMIGVYFTETEIRAYVARRPEAFPPAREVNYLYSVHVPWRTQLWAWRIVPPAP